MTPPKMRTYTRDELHAQRTEIYREWNLDEREFAPVEEWRELFFEEYVAQETLNNISFLLGER
jgi:hypothetical protein